MTNEQEIERAEKLEAAARRAFVPTPKAKPEPGQTYHGRSMMGLDGDGAIGTDGAYVVGSQENVTPPYPSSGIWDLDVFNKEPPLGISVEDPGPDVTVLPYGGNVPPPEEPPTEDEAPADADAEPSPFIQRRL